MRRNGLCVFGRMEGRKYTPAYIYFVRVIVLLQPGFLVLLVRTLALRMAIYNRLCHRLASLRHALDQLGEYPCYESHLPILCKPNVYKIPLNLIKSAHPNLHNPEHVE